MLQKIIKRIEKKGIFSQDRFENSDIDMLLDLREEEPFDSEWMRVFYILEQKEISESEKYDIERIREKAYLVTYEVSGSSYIAGYVSDDFEIIAKAYIIGLNDKWLNALIWSYTMNEFPCGDLKLVDCDMEEVYKNLIK